MPAQRTTRAQVSGYRFLLRRTQHALIRGDSRLIHDPMRGQTRAMTVGLVVALLIAGAAGVLAFFKPTPNFGNSTIMFDKPNGALYVRIGDELHPALNLASARLIAGKNDAPQQVDEKFLDTVGRGPTVGVIGAPSAVHLADDPDRSAWTACDTTGTPTEPGQLGAASIETTVLTNDPVLEGGVRAASPDEAVLARAGGSTYLLYDGVRAVIDPADPVLSAALGLRQAPVREVSSGLLNAFPLVEPIVPVTIPGAGTLTGYLPPQYRVGSLLKTDDVSGHRKLYVVLADGLQAVPKTAADIIRFGATEPGTNPDPVDIPPGLVSGAPVADSLSADHYPDSSPKLDVAESDSVLCLTWERDGSGEPNAQMLVGGRLPIVNDAHPVHLATADGNGPGLDSVYVKPGTGEYVQAAGSPSDGRANGQLFYVNDAGTRFHVADEATATILGMTGSPAPGGGAGAGQPAPWSILSLLPAGPELSKQAALMAHDGMAADERGVPIPPPRG